jgi:hypothetical protein
MAAEQAEEALSRYENLGPGFADEEREALRIAGRTE